MKNYNATEHDKILIAMSSKDFSTLSYLNFPELFDGKIEFEIGAGWRPVLWELLEKLSVVCGAEKAPFFSFTQIKEKFGFGRFYYDLKLHECPLSSVIGDLVSKYERICGTVCAASGAWYEDKIIIGGWVYDICLEEFLKRFPDTEKSDLAKKWVARSANLNRLKRLMMYLSDEEISDWLKIAEERAAY